MSSSKKELNPEYYINKLNSIFKNSNYNSNKFLFNEKEINNLIYKAKDVFMTQPCFIEIESPVNIYGDIHGQYIDLLRIFSHIKIEENVKYLFLGDYVDRGKHSLETICLLLSIKILYPNNIFLLRGNHESSIINRVYGFYDECKRRVSIKVWKSFIDVFNCMPASACIDDKILCMHGGLSQHISDLDSLRRIVRPTEVPNEGLLCDLLWADPMRYSYYNKSDWSPNDRGISFTFNEKVVKTFLEKHNLDLIVRAHQVVEEGYEFFADRRLVTIFSAPNYCGEFDNKGGVLYVDEDLKCHFKIIKPISTEKYLISSKSRQSTPPKYK